MLISHRPQTAWLIFIMVIASLIALSAGFDEKYIEHNRKTIGFLFTAADASTTTTAAATTNTVGPTRHREIGSGRFSSKSAGRGAAAQETIKTLSGMRGPNLFAQDADDLEAESFKPRARVKRIDRLRALRREKSSAPSTDRDRHSSRRLLRRFSSEETDPAVEGSIDFGRESLMEDGTFLNDRLSNDRRNRLEDIYPDLQAVSDRLNLPSKRLKAPVGAKSQVSSLEQKRDRREEDQYDDVNCGSEEGNLRDCYYDNKAKSVERSNVALDEESSYAAPVKRSSIAQARKSKKKSKKHKSKNNNAIKHKGKEKTRRKGKPKHTALTSSSSARINPLSKLTETSKCAGGAREKSKSLKSTAVANAGKTAASKHTVIISTSGNSNHNNNNNGNKDAKMVIDLLQQLIQKVDSLHGLVNNIGNNPSNSNDNQQSSDESESGTTEPVPETSTDIEITTSTESPACSDPNWTAWTSCSVTCGRGIETRTRGCLDEGHVLATEERLCQMPDCPQKFLGLFR